MSAFKGAAAKQAANAQVLQKGSKLGDVAKRSKPESKRWAFSFRFYRQHEFFGFDGDKIDQIWLVSLMERLSALGNMTIDDIVASPASAQAFRFHPIDWQGINVPIARKDLNWVDSVYLDDEENYPIRQFSVSTSLGRVVGFFDENQIFQIVLLDPLHNIQPSKDFGYVVDPCQPMGCELTQLRAAVEASINAAPSCQCGVATKVRENLYRKTRQYLPPILLTPVDEQTLIDARELMEMNAVTYSEIVTAGIDALLYKQN